MRLVHESADGTTVLATDVETADSLVEQTKGLMFRSSVPADYALVFRFEPGLIERLHGRLASAIDRLPAPLDRLSGSADVRNIHMLFVRVPLDVIWVDNGTVVQVKTLQPWRGVGGASADTVIEMAAGSAEGLQPGDTVRLATDAEPAVGDESVVTVGDSEESVNASPALDTSADEPSETEESSETEGPLETDGTSEADEAAE